MQDQPGQQFLLKRHAGMATVEASQSRTALQPALRDAFEFVEALNRETDAWKDAREGRALNARMTRWTPPDTGSHTQTSASSRTSISCAAPLRRAGNIRHNKGLNPFHLRGEAKVRGQWHLFCLAHNIEKLARAGIGQAAKRVK